jgi:hypothetical protein
MKNTLLPPQEVSGDGREIYGWAARLSAHTSRLDKMRRLNADIRATGANCGDCEKWMKSRECPQERNVHGISRGPSMAGIKCVQFVESPRATKRRAEFQLELQKVEAEHAAAT